MDLNFSLKAAGNYWLDLVDLGQDRDVLHEILHPDFSCVIQYHNTNNIFINIFSLIDSNIARTNCVMDEFEHCFKVRPLHDENHFLRSQSSFQWSYSCELRMEDASYNNNFSSCCGLCFDQRRLYVVYILCCVIPEEATAYRFDPFLSRRR